MPPAFQREDGTNRLRPRHQTLYTSKALLDAEAALLVLANDTNVPRLAANMIERHVVTEAFGPVLSDQQTDALAAIAVSGRIVDSLVGPAGAGKTTALAALRAAWEAEHGPGSVVGLAPSATAAAVLTTELGIATENTAKWLSDHHRTGTTFGPGQLVIVDEASLAGTFSLAQIAGLAAQAGAKLLLRDYCSTRFGRRSPARRPRP